MYMYDQERIFMCKSKNKIFIGDMVNGEWVWFLLGRFGVLVKLFFVVIHSLMTSDQKGKKDHS